MEELAAETGETVHLGALEGNQVRYVDGLESERALRVVARTGTLAPAHCTSLGKALLAKSDRAEALRWLRHGSKVAAKPAEVAAALRVAETQRPPGR